MHPVFQMRIEPTGSVSIKPVARMFQGLGGIIAEQPEGVNTSCCSRLKS